MKLLAAILVAGLVGFCSPKTEAQTQTTPNLITSGTSHTWTGVVNSSTVGGGFSGGNTPAYNSTNGVIYFGYNQATVAQSIAINQALSGSGVQIGGYNYSWQYLNNSSTGGTLAANVYLTSNSGSVLESYNYQMNTVQDGWRTVSGTQNFNQQYNVADVGRIGIKFTGKDARWWAGYYGPQVANVRLSLNYSADICASNPLSSPSCSGYQQALTDQQCASNPLYSTQCSGYSAAYLNQQCSSNPLYSTQCSGYAQAAHDQMCTANPLYATDCPNYRTAYHDQQCSLNPLYMSDCTGYQQAYTQQQCTANPLYSTSCSGYQQAYINQQCSLNPLYATTCAGYTQAYHNQQCSLNPLYMNDCTGYQAAYKTQQCTANPLYATDCPGYDQAYLNAQCIKDSLYSKLCTGYATAYAIKYLVPVENSSAVNQVLSNTTAAAVAPPVTIVQTPVESATTTPSTTSATSQTSVTSVVAPQQTTTSPTSPVAQSQQPAPPPPPAAGGQQEQKPSGPTSARQALAERRQEAAKAEAVAKGKELAKKMGDVKSMEDQVATQNLIVGAMGYTPGFDSYGKTTIPDAAFYRPYTVYNNQRNIDNRRVLRMFGGSDSVHQQMVESQYKKEE
jgi:hypothetical protein